MTFHGHAPRSPEKVHVLLARAAVVRAGRAHSESSFTFIRWKWWPHRFSTGRRRHELIRRTPFFLFLFSPPYTPLRHRFYEAFRSAGTFCLQTRLRSSPPLFLIAPSSRYYHSLPLFPPIVYFLFFLFFSFSSPPAPFHFFFVFVYERGSLCIEYTGCASNKTFFFFTLVQIIYQLARVNSYSSRGS